MSRPAKVRRSFKTTPTEWAAALAAAEERGEVLAEEIQAEIRRYPTRRRRGQATPAPRADEPMQAQVVRVSSLEWDVAMAASHNFGESLSDELRKFVRRYGSQGN